jgi:predicted Zn-dependent protease
MNCTHRESVAAAVYDRRLFVDFRKTRGHRPPLQDLAFFLKIFTVIAVLCVPLKSSAQVALATTDPVLRAMEDELQRSIKELQFRDLEKPYFIQYTIMDEDEYSADATFGAITRSDRARARALVVQVRVGSYDFDNSEFVTGGGFGGGGGSNGVFSTTIIDDNYDAVRHALWLSTDAAYKQAVEQIARKRAFVQNKVQEEKIPDFSKETSLTAIGGKRTLTFDQARWEKSLRDWSAIFKSFPDIEQSGVTLNARLTHRYIVNSEGTRTMQPALIVSLRAGGAVQASDGMLMTHSVPFNSTGFDQLPPSETIAATIKQLATDLTAVRNAPLLDADYSGPVLLVGQASAEMFARVLAPNLSGQRQPLSDRDQGVVRSELIDRMNRPVLPRYVTVVDDPTETKSGDKELIGSYHVDDQGVPAKKVTLIQDGVLKDLLMSRRPSKERPQSNGHGRSGFPGRESAQIGNLFIKATEGKSHDELKKALIEMCKNENLTYGIMIRAIDSDGRGPLGAPVLTYKVYVDDGREELVRGGSVNTLSVRSLRQIEAVGSDSFVVNRLTGAQNAATPSSVVAPSVLLEELDLKRPTAAQQKPALLTHPFFKRP